MVFALQGVMASPHPAGPASIADDIAGDLGNIGGSLGAALIPSIAKDAAIKAAGGIVPP